MSQHTKREAIPGKVVGCTLMREYAARLDEDEREFMTQRILEFRHLYPCPKYNGGWISKEKYCSRCKFAKRSNV